MLSRKEAQKAQKRISNFAPSCGRFLAALSPRLKSFRSQVSGFLFRGNHARSPRSLPHANPYRHLRLVLLALAGDLLSRPRGDDEKLVRILRERVPHGGAQRAILPVA